MFTQACHEDNIYALFLMFLLSLGSEHWLLSGPVPHWYCGLPGGHSGAAGDEVGAGLQTHRRELQTHEAELDMAARTDDVLAAGFVMLHPLSAGGTGPDGGDRICPAHLGEVGEFAGLQQPQLVVCAAGVCTSVRARGRAFPGLTTLPTKEVGLFLFL